jgi:acetyl-CoA synthetase
VEPLPSWVWEIPERFNIGVACTDAHLGTPTADRAAVVVDDDARGVRQLTFAELAAETSRFGQLLRDLGVAAGDRVLIRLPNCLEYPVVFLGAMKRGAIPVPTSSMLTAEEVLHLAGDSGAVALVTDGGTWSAMQAALESRAQLRHVLVVGDGAPSRPSRLAVHDLAGALRGVGQIGRAHV